jgi:hypothetical protein
MAVTFRTWAPKDGTNVAGCDLTICRVVALRNTIFGVFAVKRVPGPQPNPLRARGRCRPVWAPAARVTALWHARPR